MSEAHIEALQRALRQDKLDGWLFYSFRGSDPIAENILKLDHAKFTTRRWFYFVPAKGTPQKIVHAIETGTLDSLPGDKHVYLPWQQLHERLKQTLAGIKKVAMQYSPMNAIPYVSRVDAGTIELIRSFGVEVVSSADLVQVFEAVWTDDQLQTHLYAAKHMREIVDVVAREVRRRVQDNAGATEVEIQSFLLEEYERRGLVAGHPPIVAINAHSADPHYAPNLDDNLPMRKGDFLLVDMWSKRKVPHAVYDDITWTYFIGDAVPSEHQKIFDVVRNGRDAAINAAQQRYPTGEILYGWQIDEEARQSITKVGYGEYFIHRTGHNIHEEVHGNGANIDNLETQDSRRLMCGTCFSIEPGVYLKGNFGVRSEVDMYLSEKEAIVTGLPIQTEVIPILK
ncbi:MAG: aminopeptidase P family protein [Blastocatellia bacterium]|nr:aminopeptidase P family protein [Blastocatellia bacterium]